MNLLVTGAAGFIGSHFVRIALEREVADRIVILDALTYAGNLATIADVFADPRVTFRPGLIQDRTVVDGVIHAEGITHLVNFAAESHNDRSLLAGANFVDTNVLGVSRLLDATRDHGLVRLVHVSTDEVYGTTTDGEFTEASPLEPNTPYSAAKAGGDLQCRAHHKAYRTPVIVTRGGNTYGPYQFPEKLVPFFAVRLLLGKRVPLYGEGNQSREWIHARDHAAGILHALLHGTDGEIYNVGDVNERPNREIVRMLLEETGRGEEFVRRIEDPRKGAHDFRYSMSAAKLGALGWRPEVPFESALRETVRWYSDRKDWWGPLVSDPAYLRFIASFYGAALGDDL